MNNDILVTTTHFFAGTESRSYVESAVAEWSDKTCVQFREKADDDSDYIEFLYEVGYVQRIQM